jgi:hypothetical protein
MNIKHLLTPVLIWSVALGFSACSNDKKDTVNPTDNSIQSLFQQIKETPQSFTVSAGTAQTITGTRGTVITFHPQSFKDGSGNIINSGTVNIKLTEAYTPGQMITNGVTTTTAAHKQLMSGGCVKIEATINNQQVFANNYSIAFKQPAPSNNPMGLFTGYQTNDLAGANIKWNDDITQTVERTTKDSVNTNFFYSFDTCVNFNWINCDYFYTAPDPKTDITVVMPDSSYNAQNTQVFAIFPTLNSVSTLYSYNAATHSFSFGYSGYHVPLGMTIKIMVMGGKNNVFFMDLQPAITVTNNISITANPVTKTKEYIQTQLSSL